MLLRTPLYLALALLLLSPLVLADDAGDFPDRDGTNGDRFQFAGNSGELRIRDATGYAIKTKFHSLEEVTANGVVVSATRVRLEDASFVFASPKNATFPGTDFAVLQTGFSNTATVVRVTSPSGAAASNAAAAGGAAAGAGGDMSHDGPARNNNGSVVIAGTCAMTVSIYRFVDNATLPNGVTVPAGGVKFSVDLGAWPFASADNKLRLTFKVEVEGGDNDAKNNQADRSIEKKGDGSKERSVRMPGGKGRMDFALSATADGVDTAVSIIGFRTDDGEGGVGVILPHYTTSLSYDPTLTTQASSGTPVDPSSMGAAAATSTSFGLLLALAAITLAAFGRV